tara:strand:+ start:3255 stop:3887 length:633 start_codon:yes stop_codon:yes gene_type:complete
MADTKSLSQFKSKLAGGGARPNLFEVSIPSFPSAINEAWGSGDGQESGIFNFLCKAAQLPASSVASVPVPFRGRILKVAGDRTFAEWTVSIINDEDFRMRTAFERWANVMSKLDDATGVTNPTSYMADAYVRQLGRGAQAFAQTNDGGQSSVLRTYKFYDIFPSEISAIDLSYDNGDQIEEFSVTFQVQYFTIGDSMESNTSDNNQVAIS